MSDSDMIVPTVRFDGGRLELIDQTRLPGEYQIISLESVAAVCEAITALRVRGAPALGVTGAYGLLVAIEERWPGSSTGSLDPGTSVAEVRAVCDSASKRLRATRPTAVNLGWALDRMRGVYDGECPDAGTVIAALLSEAAAIHAEDIAMCEAIGRHGAALLTDGDNVLTHCNTGGLATGGYGTALGVIFSAVKSGKKLHVFADETRPLLQGSRLTAWECQQNNVPVTVLVEGAAPSLLSQGRVASVIVGADRIAANGDTANKIGTLGLAVNASRCSIPFYVAAPSSTIDLAIADGTQIPIEMRDAEEVCQFGGLSTAPEGVDAYNPAFDITPAELITAIITEDGIVRPPFDFRT